MVSMLVGGSYWPPAERKVQLFRWPFRAGRRCSWRALRVFCSSFGEFSLLTPFRLSPLFFLPFHFLLAFFERDAHRSPRKPRATLTSLRVVRLPARFARLASRFAVILMRESATAATTTGAAAAAIA